MDFTSQPNYGSNLMRTVNTPSKGFLESILGPDYTVTLIFILLGIVILFFLLREILTWYWKINKQIELLEKIEQNTRPKEMFHEPLEKSDIK